MPNDRKASIRQSKSLSKTDMEWLKEKFPEVAFQMLRLTFHHANMSSPNRWLEANCSGFYHCPNNSYVSFEKDEDAVAFKMAFEGK